MTKRLASGIIFLITLGLTSFPSFAGAPADTHPELHLIPWPKSVELGTGHMSLSGASRIVASDEQLQPLANVLSEEIALLTGWRLQVTSGPSQSGDIVLKINAAIRADEPILIIRDREPVRTTDGAHAITIDEQATVTGFDYRATTEGTATILQLIGKSGGAFHLPKLSIKDWPHADYCGVMLDVARQDHPPEAIRKVIQLCRLYKARYLQLHLTDDQGWTFPSTRYPQLGSQNYGAHGGVAPRVYRLDELKALVAYADARGVTIVPELELPGHSGAASRSLPEIFDAIDPQSKQPVGIGCMNMSNEAIYPALETIIGEMCDVFGSSPFFHIGSDEVTSGRLSLHPGYKAFMEKHKLKNDSELADHFIAAACAMVKQRGKKAIKWEGLSNYATKDVIIMAWEGNSTVATEALSRGYTTITCPWNLGVPWEEWNMYRCNASQLHEGDSVLGATLVAWEQPPATHIANLRQLPSRQERTWGPKNQVTVAGFAARFQPLDAVAGKLLALLPKPKHDATFVTTAGTRDFLDPVFAFDGNDATFFKSATAPRQDDHFTVTFPELKLVDSLEVLTGINGRGQLSKGEVQISANGTQFTTVGVLERGAAKIVLKEHRLRAVRLRAATPQSEPLVVRAINLRLMVEVSGVISNPTATVGEENVAVTTGDTEFAYPIGSCAVPVLNGGFTLKLSNGGNACQYSGPISGKGRVELYAGGESAPLVLDGAAANTLQGEWFIKAGRVELAKAPGVTAIGSAVAVGGQGHEACLLWGGNDQVDDGASIELLKFDQGSACLNLNGYSDTIDRLTLNGDGKVLTDSPQSSGVLTVRELMVNGQRVSKGVYASPASWLQGTGYVVVGDVKRVDVMGVLEDPSKAIGDGNIAVLKSASTWRLPAGDCSIAVNVGDFPLTLFADGGASYSGFIAGNGTLRIEALTEGALQRKPLVFSGAASNAYKGDTMLVRGALKLNKPAGCIAIPGNLALGGSAAENKGDSVIWGADGQLSPSAVVTLQGDQPAYLDLDGHKVSVAKVVLSSAGQIRTGNGGTLRVKQLYVAGQRLKDAAYSAPQSWLDGTGTVTVDSRVDLQGVYSAPEVAIGPGNVGNLIGDTKFAYPSSGCNLDVSTNGFTLTFDSGNGNAFAYSGSVTGTGNMEFFMGPTYTGHKDAPLRLAGDRPNTASGKFLVKKGRVQLEKPPGVDAISSDAIVGGQGFNDCFFWINSHQIKDSANVSLLDAGNSGAAYLHLNGCSETIASLTLTKRNKVSTDSLIGASGVLTVRSLVIDGVNRPAGTYSAPAEDWIEGQGSVIVQP